jgi:peptidyl-dipeptidase A
MLSLRIALPLVLGLAALAAAAWPAGATGTGASERARKFVEAYTAKIRPLEVAANRAWWDANITGKDEDFKKKEEAQNRIDAVLADKAAFREVKALKEAGTIDDPILKRAVDVIYLAYLEKQLDPALLKRMTALSNTVEKQFSTFRAKVDGKEMTDAAWCGRPVKRLARSSKAGSGNSSGCATRPPAGWGSRTITPSSSS